MECIKSKTLSISDVRFEVGDKVGELLALFSLLPIFIVAQLTALIFVRRDWQTFLVLAGIIVNVVLNKIIKDTLQHPRPIIDGSCAGIGETITMFEEGSFEEFGMPSNHSQFMGFVSTYVILFLLFRVKAPRFEKLLLITISASCASLVAYSRIYLKYHSTDQVAVGLIVGMCFGVAWFILYICYFESLGKAFVKSKFAKFFLIRETSHIPNVALFEYNAIQSDGDSKK
jgi:dolichyldiphosphatase